MSDPLGQAAAAAALRGQWGVYDQHTRRWVVSGCGDERAAWQALLRVDSLHPWELAVRHSGAEDPAAPPLVPCSLCDGEGDCPTCEQECPACGGTGEVEEEPPRRRPAVLSRVG